MGAADSENRDWQRLDAWLWCARLVRHRADCGRLLSGGAPRINRVPTDKLHARVRVGDVLTLPVRHRVLVLEVLALAARRGPAAQARALYRVLADAPEGHRAGGCEGVTDTAYPPPEAEPPNDPPARSA